MDAKELRALAAKKLSEADAILSAAKDGLCTADETAKIDALQAEHDRLQAQADQVEGLSKRKADLNLSTGKPVIGGGAISVEHQFEKDPKKGFESPREFLKTVLDVALGKKRAGDNLKYLSAERIALAAGSDEQGTYDDARGGFLVPEGFSPQLLTIGSDGDPTVGRTQMVPMNTPSVKIPARVDKDHSSSVSGGLRVYRRAEATQATSSRMLLEMIRLEVETLMALTFETEELLADSAISFIALIQSGFQDEFASKRLDEKLRGTGAGQMMGILTSPAKISVAKESGQAAASVNFTNIVKMRARSWHYGDAIWMANHDIIPSLALMADAGGRLLWNINNPGNAIPGSPDTLLGRPIIFNEAMETLGTEGDLILVNWSQYLEAIYQPLQSAESIHVRFDYHERAFKFWMRDAGAPWWRTALTPKKGSNTLSPIVTLATRA